MRKFNTPKSRLWFPSQTCYYQNLPSFINQDFILPNSKAKTFAVTLAWFLPFFQTPYLILQILWSLPSTDPECDCFSPTSPLPCSIPPSFLASFTATISTALSAHPLTSQESQFNNSSTVTLSFSIQSILWNSYPTPAMTYKAMLIWLLPLLWPHLLAPSPFSVPFTMAPMKLPNVSGMFSPRPLHLCSFFLELTFPKCPRAGALTSFRSHLQSCPMRPSLNIVIK